MKRNIQVDREFMNLAAPISDEEQERLERSLMREGCLEPIITWRGIILDGHKRFKFCSYEEIDYEVQEMDFDSREEAVMWVCKRRTADLDKNSPAFRYLIGKWYICKKQRNKEKRRVGDTPQNPEYVKKKRNSVWDTCSRMAEEIGIHRTTISKCGGFAEAMDAIVDTEPALFEAILREDLRFTYAQVIDLSHMDAKQLGEFRRKQIGIKDIKMRRRNRKDAWDGNGELHLESEIPLKTGIKEMPAFDPDMELKGLTLTVPTWINVIARAERKTDMSQASGRAKEQLAINLQKLQDQIGRTLEVLR